MSIETIECPFNGTLDFGKKVMAKLPSRDEIINDDMNKPMLSHIYLKIDLPEIDLNGINVKWHKNIGLHIINYVEFYIGNELIDRQTNTYIHLSSQHALIYDQINGFNKMIGNINELTEFQTKLNKTSLFIPLTFSFCRNRSDTIPVYKIKDNMRIVVHLNDLKDCLICSENINLSNIHLNESSLFCDYIQDISTVDKNEYTIKQIDTIIENVDNLQSMQLKVPFNLPIIDVF